MTKHLEFSGSSSDYAKLWFTNLALNIISFGWYSPWAKVRAQKYLLGHTKLEDVAFDYTADPVKILKGRLIIVGIFAAFGALSQILPIIAPFIGLLVLAVAPVIVVKSLQFKARYTTYRNLSFHFAGKISKAFVHFLALPLASLLTLGLAFPWVQYKQRQFVVDNLRYGRAPFQFGGKIWPFFLAYLLAFLLLLFPVAIFLIRTVLDTFFGDISSPVIDLIQGSVGAFLMVVGGALAYFVAPALIRVMLAKATWDGLRCGPFLVKIDATTTQLLKLVLINTVLLVCTLGLTMPFITIRTRRFLARHTQIQGEASFAGFSEQQQVELRALGTEAADIYDMDVDFGF